MLTTNADTLNDLELFDGIQLLQDALTGLYSDATTDQITAKDKAVIVSDKKFYYSKKLREFRIEHFERTRNVGELICFKGFGHNKTDSKIVFGIIVNVRDRNNMCAYRQVGKGGRIFSTTMMRPIVNFVADTMGSDIF